MRKKYISRSRRYRSRVIKLASGYIKQGLKWEEVAKKLNETNVAVSDTAPCEGEHWTARRLIQMCNYQGIVRGKYRPRGGKPLFVEKEIARVHKASSTSENALASLVIESDLSSEKKLAILKGIFE